VPLGYPRAAKVVLLLNSRKEGMAKSPKRTAPGPNAGRQDAHDRRGHADAQESYGLGQPELACDVGDHEESPFDALG